MGNSQPESEDVRRFEATVVDTSQATISVTYGGKGPGLLLLHGFPETKLMWRDIAPSLANRFSVVCADLRGYGDSSSPATDEAHEAYSKRAMARDMIEVMTRLGHPRFAVAGHDRGGRVAYRAALDHPDRITALVVLDVLPVDVVWERADDRMALGFWPWSLLAQPAPLPELLVGAVPDAVIDHALGTAWGTPADTFPDNVRRSYRTQLANPDHLHAICEEYRAAADTDRRHDSADRRAGRRITCPVLALWSDTGPLATWYVDLGGPLAIWRDLADDVIGHPVDGGHFFPEEHPEQVADALANFVRGALSR